MFVGFNPQQQQDCCRRPLRLFHPQEVVGSHHLRHYQHQQIFQDIWNCCKPNPGSGNAGTKEILLQQLQDQPFFQVVSVLAKILMVITDGRRVQAIQVGDRTSSVELAPRQTFVNSVQVNKSYKLVKVYKNECSFTPKQTDVTINQIADLPNVISPTRSIKHMSEIEHATVIAVARFNSFCRCISCHDGQVLPIGNLAYGSEAGSLLQEDLSLLTIHSSSNAYPLKLLAVDQLTKIASLPLEQVMGTD